MSLLNSIDSPADLKKLSAEERNTLAEEIRERLVEVLCTTGGHLAPNLGIVELTIALHVVFDSPRDQIVWDVSHQSYVHKLLTGRRDRFPSIRQYGGLSGYTNRQESEYDPFGAGHASTAISAALGLARARDHRGEENAVIAVIGDGAMTGGLAFEGLNNVGTSGSDLLIVLNDNDMSIAPNVGAIHEYFTTAISNPLYNKAKNLIWETTGKLPLGKTVRTTVHKLDESIKNLLTPGLIFERLGLRYFGPVDGHDIDNLIRHLQDIRKINGPKLLHIKTVKGRGYQPAEDDACGFHGTGAFDKITGEGKKKNGPPAYHKVFGQGLVEECRRDERIVGITGAMPNGTGLDYLAEEMPERFYDVGIAEGHAVCFSAGLAAGGMKPVCVIYSTFLQRGFDQIIHDVALQNLNVFFCLDRGGLVGDDGPTHHGTFDLSYMRVVPNLVVMAAADENELRRMIRTGVLYEDGPIALRYPRGAGEGVTIDPEPRPLPIGQGVILREGSDIALLAVGRMVGRALEAADLLATEGIEATVANARFVKPLDTALIDRLAGEIGTIVTLEENSIRGGFGAGVLEYLSESGQSSVRTLLLGLPDAFITHGTIDILFSEVGLDPESIARRTREFSNSMKKKRLGKGREKR